MTETTQSPSPAPREKGTKPHGSAQSVARGQAPDLVGEGSAVFPPPPMRAAGPPEDGLCETDPDGFGAFAALGDIDHYTLALIEGGDPGSLEH